MGLFDNKKYPLRDMPISVIPEQYQTNQYQSPVMQDLMNYQDFGMRYDNSAPKGMGFFGQIPTAPNPPYQGSSMTEFSIGVPLAGKEREIPSLVPTLVPQEIDWMRNGGAPTDEIKRKAYAHALMRYKNGMSPFAD